MPGVSKPKPKSKTSGKTAAVGAKRSPLTASSEKPAPVSVPAKSKNVSREDEEETNEDLNEDEEGPKEKKKKKVLKEKELKGKEDYYKDCKILVSDLNVSTKRGVHTYIVSRLQQDV